MIIARMRCARIAGVSLSSLCFSHQQERRESRVSDRRVLPAFVSARTKSGVREIAGKCRLTSASAAATTAQDASPERPAPEPPSASSSNSAFIFGLGYTGLGLACMLLEEGWSVSGTVRSAAAARDLETLLPGLRAFAFAGGEESPLSGEALEALRGSARVFSTVPPVSSDPSSSSSPLVDPVLAAHAVEIFASARFVGYVSSTSVYGSDLGGQTVDEESELRPDTAAGTLRARAESEWKEAAAAAAAAFSSRSSPSARRSVRLAIVRAGGIYGPGRSALDSEEVLSSGSTSPSSPSVSKAASGERDKSDAASSPPPTSRQQPQEADRPTARIHVLDLCRLLRAQAVSEDERQAEEGEASGAGGRASPSVVICNAVDGDPAPRSAAMRAARELLGIQVEGEEERSEEGGEAASKPGSKGKVVSGERTWSVSGLSPVFASVFRGLEGIHEGDSRPFGEGKVPERKGKRGRRGGGGRGGDVT